MHVLSTVHSHLPCCCTPLSRLAGLRSAESNRLVQLVLSGAQKEMDTLVSNTFEHDVNKDGIVDIFDIVAFAAAKSKKFAAFLPKDFFPTGGDAFPYAETINPTSF